MNEFYFGSMTTTVIGLFVFLLAGFFNANINPVFYFGCLSIIYGVVLCLKDD